MPYRRPGAATAAGVMAIIYGSVFSLCGLCGILTMAIQGAGNNFMVGNDPQQIQFQKAMLAALDRDVPSYQVYEFVTGIVGLICASFILLAGIGILYLRRWARVLAIVLSLVLVALSLFQAVYQLALVAPALARFFEAGPPVAIPQGNAGLPPADFLKVMRILMSVMTVGAAIVYFVRIVYLFVIVVLLSRRHVRAAFANPVSDMYEERPLDDDGAPHADDDEDDWEQRRSRRDDRRDR